MTIAINGWSSAIAKALTFKIPREPVLLVDRGADMPLEGVERYLFCQGLLYPLKSSEQGLLLRHESLHVNFEWIKGQCDRIIKKNDLARICVIGSESGFVGSYDDTYAFAKRALHAYVESKALRTPNQQLICIAPSIIADAGMTTRRTDADNLAARQSAHPKGRFLKADEVAGLVHHVLFVDQGYLSGVVIRMNGGAHCGEGRQGN